MPTGSSVNAEPPHAGFGFGAGTAGCNLPDVPPTSRTDSDAPVLIIDSATPVTRVGLATSCRPGAPTTWRSSRDEAGVAVFREAASLLEEAGVSIPQIGRFIFCDGPGSILGIRLGAMALRTWLSARPPAAEGAPEVLSFRSLELVAASLLADRVAPPFSVIADARRKSWYLLRVAGDGTIGPIERVPGERIAAASNTAEPTFAPEDFPRWQPLPDGVRLTAYEPERLPSLVAAGHLQLRPCREPDAWMADAPTYREWDPSARPAPPTPRPRRAQPGPNAS